MGLPAPPVPFMNAIPPLSDAEIRRGYLIAGGLALGIAVSNGIGRFSYALVLPAMQADLGWSYTEAGALSTANAVGYLIGSFLAMTSIRRLGPSILFTGGMWVTVAAILLMGGVEDYVTMIVLRTIAGLSGAAVLISGSVLAASIFPDQPRLSAAAIAIYFSGGGFGLLLPGLTIPWLLAAGGDAAWPWAWIGMGVFSGLVGILTMASSGRVNAPPAQKSPHPWARLPMLPIFVAYALHALGYFAYMTFIVAWMREHGATAAEIAGMWIVLALSATLSFRIWARPIGSWKGGKAIAVIQFAVGVGAFLPLLGASLPIMLLSAILFGFFFMVPAAITAFVKTSLPAVVWGEAVAAFTLTFAALQIVGPIVTGAIADRTGSLAWGLGASAAMLTIGALIALLQRDHPYPKDPA